MHRFSHGCKRGKLIVQNTHYLIKERCYIFNNYNKWLSIFSFINNEKGGFIDLERKLRQSI